MSKRLYSMLITAGLVMTALTVAHFSTLNANQESSQTKQKTRQSVDTTMSKEKEHAFEVKKSEQEWREELTEDEFEVLREAGTELPFINKYYRTEKEGIYVCAACGNKLFSSETKYHSGSGWPAFYAPVNKEAVVTESDNSFFMERTEVLCSRCGSHLGHVFEDGPQPTGLRYCINSVALDLIQQNKEKSK